MSAAASVHELKNQTTRLLRIVEKGAFVIVTRHGKPIATLKPFEEQDRRDTEQYPTSTYDTLRKRIEETHPEFARRTSGQLRQDFDRITQKAGRKLPFANWQEMDRALKGDRYGLTR
ncbi:MAG: type II toxin-antitoxin system prevent-host-death family antitoxin [Deltaproteobacteria bacterium]|nr:type II toxin-antitoxin system prevent-host-death family antitoxin [Deltaproteobacteria bacterium]